MQLEFSRQIVLINTQILNFMKIRLVCFMRKDRQAVRLDEANYRFSQLCYSA